MKYPEPSEFTVELVEILNRQYTQHHFTPTMVQMFVDRALESSGQIIVKEQASEVKDVFGVCSKGMATG